MARPRNFDEAEVVALAAGVFATQAYDGVSIDELVSRLGVHRNSLYKVFGSKRGLYLAALRHSRAYDVGPLLERITAAGSEAERLESARRSAIGGLGLDLILLAATEQAPRDREVAGLVNETFAALDRAAGGSEVTARMLGERVRARAVSGDDHR